MTEKAELLPAHSRALEPELAFHPTRAGDRDVHPLSGLVKFGPFSRALINSVLDPVRLALIAPASRLRDLEALVAELEGRHQPVERKQYLPVFPGFSAVFGLRIVLGASGVQVGLPDSVTRELSEAAQPHVLLGTRLREALQRLSARRGEFDVALVLLPSEWEAGFHGPEGDDFNLHDFVKAAGAALDIPTQLINEGPHGALGYRCRCSVAWRLGIALYTKAGGVPWKIADADEGTAYIGLSYALRSGGSAGQFVTCCSQVFDADGAGLEFIAYETGDMRVERDNPYLSRGEMRRVIARSLVLYQRRHAGRTPKAVTIHKSTEFKPDEVEGAFDALRAVADIELLHVQRNTLWRGVDIEAPRDGVGKGRPASYPCDRGIYQPLGPREVLLWTQGNAKEAADGKDFFKEGKGIPAPLLLTRYAGRGGWSETCRSLLGLTKMNWNNDGLYDRLPVTMAYARTLADVVKRMPQLASRPYQVRFFM